MYTHTHMIKEKQAIHLRVMSDMEGDRGSRHGRRWRGTAGSKVVII